MAINKRKKGFNCEGFPTFSQKFVNFGQQMANTKPLTACMAIRLLLHIAIVYY